MSEMKTTPGLGSLKGEDLGSTCKLTLECEEGNASVVMDWGVAQQLGEWLVAKTTGRSALRAEREGSE